MAGGPEWFLESKKDAYYSYTTGTEAEGTLQHWRRMEVLYVISSSVQDAYVDVGPGELGQLSGVILFSLSAARSGSRVLTGDSKFICEQDELAPEQKPTGFYRRTQAWRWIGRDEEYDPDTGLAIEAAE